ncbi:hypothetical protein [Haloglycomyces albus]|uniref:hypothetical protein n=1 Tax=Haloglycomyces albus TaxID=526067 RepID=UPI00046CC9F4|nr:hypothetical protein [Haloglycomyces albus]
MAAPVGKPTDWSPFTGAAEGAGDSDAAESEADNSSAGDEDARDVEQAQPRLTLLDPPAEAGPEEPDEKSALGTRHSHDTNAEIKTAGHSDHGEGESRHSALDADSSVPTLETDTPAATTAFRERLRSEFSAPLSWQRRPAAPAEMLEWARQGHWGQAVDPDAEPERIRGLSAGWAWLAVSVISALRVVEWLIERPTRFITVVVAVLLTVGWWHLA